MQRAPVASSSCTLDYVVVRTHQHAALNNASANTRASITAPLPSLSHAST